MDLPHTPSQFPFRPPPLPLPLAPGSYCVGCQAVGPTRQVLFFQHIGAVLLMFNQHIRGRLCRNCINAAFARRTLITTFCGWWGMISVFLTPIFLLNNTIRYLFCLPLKTPPDRPASGTGLAIVALFLALGALALLATFVVLMVTSAGNAR